MATEASFAALYIGVCICRLSKPQLTAIASVSDCVVSISIAGDECVVSISIAGDESFLLRNA